MTGRETLVLLPGMMCDGRLFAPQIEAFSADCEIVVGDLTAEQTIDRLARRLLDGLPERFNLLGLSMGGIVAMAMAGIAPRRIARLGLLDTNHHADAPERRAIRDRQISDARAGKLSDIILREMMPGYFAACNRGNAAFRDLVLDMALVLGPEAFVSQTAALRDRTDLTEALRGWSGPALVMCGAEDKICTPERHREIAALLAAAEFVAAPHAAHLATLENPQAVNAAIARWLTRPALEQER
jgi:pimeloyl-ACP methyl ester carboxylesterase